MRKDDLAFVSLSYLKSIQDPSDMHKPLLAILPLLFLACQAQDRTPEQVVDASTVIWNEAQAILNEVVPPVFLDQTFNILDYGAKEGSSDKSTDAIQQAIQACTKAGGGSVLVPKGVFNTGAIHLENNVNLHLAEDAVLQFSTDPTDYLPVVQTSFEGTELMNYSPLIYAYQKKNIAITGKGLLNGQASRENWWIWKGQEEYGWKEGLPHQNQPDNRIRLTELAAQGIPVEERVFGAGYYLRPSFVEFFDCQNILIQGVKIIQAPFWIIHPIKSSNITVDDVEVDSHGPNNDGCDPEYCRNVVIKNCLFNTGDDCIAIKSGRDEDGRRVGLVSENIVVKDCKMLDGHGGVVMGSEISAGVRNVYIDNCVMDSPNLDRAIRIKTNTKRGGFVEGVYVRDLQVGQVKEALLKINLFYATYADQEGTHIPRVRKIHLQNVQVKNGGKHAILAKGHPEMPIEQITFKDVIIEQVEEPFLLEQVEHLDLQNTTINGKLVTLPDL